MDKLEIQGLAIKAIIGVYEWEKQIKQTLKFDLEIGGDFSQCQDQIENSIDYAKLSQTLEQFVENTSCQLVETLAHQSADFLMEQFKLQSLILSLSKPGALPMADNVKITVRKP